MNTKRFQDVWVEQCEAAQGIQEQHGLVAALDYLIGEKLLTFAETAGRRPEFARELPQFVAAVRGLFSSEDIKRYIQNLERLADEQEQAAGEDKDQADDDVLDTPERWAERRRQFAVLRELLTSEWLGTS